ncbi:MAG TPA: hypothetical protein VJ743_07110 [Albitalea sp.]|nr:hypothetical protein [Albitalea sp.]
MIRSTALRVLLAAACSWSAILPARAQATVTRWAPPGISSALFESHPAFDPSTGDFYFVRSSREFKGWRILASRCGDTGWSTPVPPPFAGDGVEADPWFTPDGRQLYFISTRTTDGIAKRGLDIWRVARRPDGAWSTPERLPEPVNSPGNEWFPRQSPDGWLYLGSDRAGGAGKTDIWRAREASPGQWRVENLGPAINGQGHEYEAALSPDGEQMIVMTDEGLFRSRRAASGWRAREKLGPEVNVNATEVGALFSPSGRAFLFARDTRGEASGEFFLARDAGPVEDWPPRCPR